MSIPPSMAVHMFASPDLFHWTHPYSFFVNKASMQQGFDPFAGLSKHFNLVPAMPLMEIFLAKECEVHRRNSERNSDQPWGIYMKLHGSKDSKNRKKHAKTHFSSKKRTHDIFFWHGQFFGFMLSFRRHVA